MRRHESPNPETGKSIVVIEDDSLPAGWLRVECAHSDRDFADLVRRMCGGNDLHIEVSPRKGHPRGITHMVVGPGDYDEVVRLVEDDEEAPAMTDAEFASELMRVAIEWVEARIQTNTAKARLGLASDALTQYRAALGGKPMVVSVDSQGYVVTLPTQNTNIHYSELVTPERAREAYLSEVPF